MGSENVIVMVEGATPTLTRAQSASGHRLSAISIAWLIISIPPGLSTSSSPMNLALMIFFGSSIGVGNDSGALLTVLVFNLVVKCVGLIKLELPGAVAQPAADNEDVGGVEHDAAAPEAEVSSTDDVRLDADSLRLI